MPFDTTFEYLRCGIVELQCRIDANVISIMNVRCKSVEDVILEIGMEEEFDFLAGEFDEERDGNECQD